jgi:hypothetical protein
MLTGVLLKGNCPECGRPVSESLMHQPTVRGLLAPHRRMLRHVIAIVGGLVALVLFIAITMWMLS